MAATAVQIMKISHFTPRESQVLELLLAGESKKETAWKLGISPKTISTFLASAKAKAGARTVEQLVVFCVKNPEWLER